MQLFYLPVINQHKQLLIAEYIVAHSDIKAKVIDKYNLDSKIKSVKHIRPVCTLCNAWQQEGQHQLTQNFHDLESKDCVKKNPERNWKAHRL